MSEYEYKKLVGMSVGQVVDAMNEGINVHYKVTYGIYNIMKNDIHAIKLHVSSGNIYRKIETPWWVGMEHMPVMCRNNDINSWKIDIFREYKSSTYGIERRFICRHKAWKQARPLTSAERDAIKVRG